MLKYALLGFLAYKNMTGYELKQVMDQSTGHFWSAKQSQIYSTLKTLEQQGAVHSEFEPQQGRPDRRVYRITPSGTKDLEQWLVQPLTYIESGKSTLLLKLFFSARIKRETVLMQLRLMRELWLQAEEGRHVDSRRMIDDTLRHHPDLQQDAVLWEACRRFGELHADMVLRWLEETIASIEREIRD
jgi:PadR family transcriptional regulator, regulatory protein AphA